MTAVSAASSCHAGGRPSRSRQVQRGRSVPPLPAVIARPPASPGPGPVLETRAALLAATAGFSRTGPGPGEGRAAWRSRRSEGRGRLRAGLRRLLRGRETRRRLAELITPLRREERLELAAAHPRGRIDHPAREARQRTRRCRCNSRSGWPCRSSGSGPSCWAYCHGPARSRCSRSRDYGSRTPSTRTSAWRHPPSHVPARRSA